jgi:hypothetical protein
MYRQARKEDKKKITRSRRNSLPRKGIARNSGVREKRTIGKGKDRWERWKEIGEMKGDRGDERRQGR